jgi:hypothetical protein
MSAPALTGGKTNRGLAGERRGSCRTLAACAMLCKSLEGKESTRSAWAEVDIRSSWL